MSWLMSMVWHGDAMRWGGPMVSTSVVVSFGLAMVGRDYS